MAGREELKKMVAANLRSVTQSCKGGVPFESLERDYRDLLGVPIPYGKLGYPSLIDMIRAMPDVVKLQSNGAGKRVVMAVADESTAHIASLIARQKSTARRPLRSRRPERVRRAPVVPSKPLSVRHFNKGTRAPPSYSEYSETDFWTHSSSSNDQFHVTRTVPSLPLRNSEQDVPRTVPSLLRNSEQVPIPKARVPPHGNQSKYEVPPRFLRKQEKPLSSLENNSTEDRLSSTSCTSSFRYNARQAALAGSTETHSIEEATCVVPPPARRPERITREAEPRSAREFIHNYARRNNLDCIYSTAPMGQRRKAFVSSVTLGGEKYVIYPDAKPTPEEAEEAAAEKAREAIKQSEAQRNILPVTRTNDPENLNTMLTRIEQMVVEKHKGIWNTSIPPEYEQRYREMLPPNWFTLVKECCSFYFEKVDDSRIILYPGSGRASPTSINQDDEDQIDDLERKFPSLSVTVTKLEMPKTNHFDVFVSHVHDAQLVYVRLVDYAEFFEELSEKMKVFYEQNKYPVNTIAEDKIYAVSLSGLWHRATWWVMSPCPPTITGDMVQCYLVDEGDIVDVSISSLQEMDPTFLDLPFQALRVSLAELEYYNACVNPKTLSHYLLGKSLVAEVVDSDRKSVILYDTSTEEDINLNNIIFEKTVAESLNYTLPECGSTAMAYLCNVSPCGTVYLTLNCPSNANLLTEELGRLTPICEEKAKLECVISKTCMYCAKYDRDNGWYRAVVVDSNEEMNEVEVLYVDFGNTAWIPMSCICELTAVSEYLVTLPFQSVRCTLSELPPPNLFWSDKAANRLGELAFDKELIVRVQRPGTERELPQVALYIRNEQSQIVSINQTLAFEEQLFSHSPSLKRDRLPSWTGEFFSEFNRTEYTPLPSSPYRGRAAGSSSTTVENATSEHLNLSNFIPDVAVSAEQQLAKRHGNCAVPCPPIGNECENEEEQFPPLYPTDIPEKGSLFDIFVTMAASPFNFMCQPLKSSKELDQLFSEMQSFYSNEENLCEMHSVLVRKGEFFAGKHIDGSWYRVRKQSIVSEDPLQVSVYYVDYGDICILPLPNLQPLFKQFKTLPCQSMKASLKGVKPIGHDWDPMGCYEFKKMVEEKQFVSIVESKKLQVEDHLTVYSLELILIDVSDPNVDVLIHEELIKNKIAEAST